LELLTDLETMVFNDETATLAVAIYSELHVLLLCAASAHVLSNSVKLSKLDYLMGAGSMIDGTIPAEM
jgi:hypothetical protein